MKTIFFLWLFIFSFDCNAQNTLVLETELRINKLLHEQKNIFFEDNLSNLKPLIRVNALNSGLITFLLESDSLNSSIPFNLNLQLISQFKVRENKLLFANSEGRPLAKIIGLKKADVRYLKKQFEKLQMLSAAYTAKKNKTEIDARKTMIKKQVDLPDSRLEKERIKAAIEAEKVFLNNKTKN